MTSKNLAENDFKKCWRGWRGWRERDKLVHKFINWKPQQTAKQQDAKTFWNAMTILNATAANKGNEGRNGVRIPPRQVSLHWPRIICFHINKTIPLHGSSHIQTHCEPAAKVMFGCLLRLTPALSATAVHTTGLSVICSQGVGRLGGCPQETASRH